MKYVAIMIFGHRLVYINPEYVAQVYPYPDINSDYKTVIELVTGSKITSLEFTDQVLMKLGH